MFLYLIEQPDHDFDCCAAMVVRAMSELGAQRIASTQAVDEGSQAWLDKSTVTKLGVVTADCPIESRASSAVILRCVNWG